MPTTAPQPGASKLNKEARCARWQPLTYEAPGDTPKTVNEILKHNETGARAGCWPRKKK